MRVAIVNIFAIKHVATSRDTRVHIVGDIIVAIVIIARRIWRYVMSDCIILASAVTLDEAVIDNLCSACTGSAHNAPANAVES